MSSMIARPTRNAARLAGTRVLSNARTPIANAVSVAIGTPHPPEACGGHSAAKTAAGTSIPPNAVTASKRARRGSCRSPARNSRLISSPSKKKNSAIRPSLIQCRSDIDSSKLPAWMPTLASRIES